MTNLEKCTELLAHITRPETPFVMESWVEYVSNEKLRLEFDTEDFYIDSTNAETPPELTDPNLCGTPHCAAGWALALDGNPLIDTSRIGLAIGTATGEVGKNGLPIYRWESTNEDEIHERAADILGLSEDQASYLFVTLSDSETLAVAYLSKLIYKEARRLAKKKAKAQAAESSGANVAVGVEPWSGKRTNDYVNNYLDRLNRKAHS